MGAGNEESWLLAWFKADRAEALVLQLLYLIFHVLENLWSGFHFLINIRGESKGRAYIVERETRPDWSLLHRSISS